MNKITTFNTNSLTKMRSEMLKNFEALEKKYGIKFNVGRMTYSHDNFSAKVTCSLVSNDGTVLTAEAKNLMDYGKMSGLNDDVKLNKKFYYSGQHFKVVGLATRSQKFPVICEDVNTGKSYKLPIAGVNRNINCKSINAV